MLLNLYPALLLLGGLCCLGHYVCTLRLKKLPQAVDPWQGEWSDFLWFLWLVIFGVFAGSFASDILYKGLGLASDTEDKTRFLFNGIGMQIGMLIVVCGYPLISKKDRGQLNTRTLPWPRAAAIAAYGFLAAMPLLALLQFLLTAGLDHLGIEAPLQSIIEMLRESYSLMEWAMIVLMTVVLAPLTEELLFRAGLYRFLKSRCHPSIAANISALLFALIHANAFSFLPLWLLGVFLVYSYEYSGSIRVPILWHAFFNLNTLIFLALEPSGG